MYNQRYRLCFRTKSRLTQVVVSTVRTQWSSWCSCGHLLKIALTIGPYTCGAAQEAPARRRAGGKHLIQNKLAKGQWRSMWCYSIRAWRGLRYNEKYASKLERKLAKRREHQRAPPAPVEVMPTHQNVNPFSVRCVPGWKVLHAD
jgi:hypothetical protein